MTFDATRIHSSERFVQRSRPNHRCDARERTMPRSRPRTHSINMYRRRRAQRMRCVGTTAPVVSIRIRFDAYAPRYQESAASPRSGRLCKGAMQSRCANSARRAATRSKAFATSRRASASATESVKNTGNSSHLTRATRVFRGDDSGLYDRLRKVSRWQPQSSTGSWNVLLQGVLTRP